MDVPFMLLSMIIYNESLHLMCRFCVKKMDGKFNEAILVEQLVIVLYVNLNMGNWE